MGTILKTLFLLLMCLPAFAQVDSESRTLARQLKKELDFNVEFASLILRVGAQIDSEISG